MSIINIKKQSPIYPVRFKQMIFVIMHRKKCVSLKINPVESTSVLMILWDLHMSQAEGSEALGWPGKKACVFTLCFVLLASFSGRPSTCMLKKNSRTLSQDLGLINPGQGSKIKTNVASKAQRISMVLHLLIRARPLTSIDQLRPSYKLYLELA